MSQPNDSYLHGKANRKAYLWMVVSSAIIAGSFPVVAAITPGYDPTVLTFWRFLTATVIFGLMPPFVKGVGIVHYSLTLKCLAYESLRLVQNSGVNWE
jgi:drug/metabolite transporter (DMT)-like permease